MKFQFPFFEKPGPFSAMVPRYRVFEKGPWEFQFCGSSIDTPKMRAGAFECPVNLLLVTVAT